MYADVSRERQRLTYMQVFGDTNIWRVAVPSSTVRHSSPEKFIFYARHEVEPQYSPDGKRIVFASDRSGHFEIWVCDSQAQTLCN